MSDEADTIKSGRLFHTSITHYYMFTECIKFSIRIHLIKMYGVLGSDFAIERVDHNADWISVARRSSENHDDLHDRSSQPRRGE